MPYRNNYSFRFLNFLSTLWLILRGTRNGEMLPELDSLPKKLKTHFTDHHLPKPKVLNSYKNLRLHKTHKSALTSFWLRVGVVAPAVSFRLYLTLMKRRETPICTSCCKRLWLIQCSINGCKVHCLLLTVYLFTYAYCVFTQHFMFNLFHLSP